MSSESSLPVHAKERTTSDKIAASMLALGPIIGGVASLVAIVLLALVIAAVRYVLADNVPDSAWIAAIVIVIGNSIASSIDGLKKDK